MAQVRRARRTLLAAHRRTTRLLTSARDRHQLVLTIAEQAVDLLGARGGGIYEYDRQIERLRIIADCRPERIGITLGVGEGVAGKLVLPGAPQYLFVPDYGAWPERAPVFGSGDSIQFGAVVGVPLRWHDGPIGVLYLDDEVGRVFTRRDVAELRQFADQAAIALANADLIERDRALLARLERLSRVTGEIMSDLAGRSVDGRLELVVARGAELLEAEACSILLLRRGGMLRLEAASGYGDANSLVGTSYRVRGGSATSLAARILQSGDVFNASGEALHRELAASAEPSPGLPSGGYHSLLAVPLRGEGEVPLGLLKFENRLGKLGAPCDTCRFSGGEDELVARSFAAAVVVALSGAEVVERFARLVDSSPLCVIANDGAGRITHANARAGGAQVRPT